MAPCEADGSAAGYTPASAVPDSLKERAGEVRLQDDGLQGPKQEGVGFARYCLGPSNLSKSLGALKLVALAAVWIPLSGPSSKAARRAVGFAGSEVGDWWCRPLV